MADFGAARDRVAARRQQREDAIRNARVARQEQLQSTHPALARLPTPFATIWNFVDTQWLAVSGREGTKPAFRVGQVDAELLDDELLELLKGQVGEGLKYYGTHLRDDWSAEVAVVLRAILFKLSVWDHDASYGASLQNLRYTDARKLGIKNKDGLVSLSHAPPARWQKALYGLISVGGRYAWSKWEDYLLSLESDYDYDETRSSSTISKLSSLSSLLSTAHSTAAFVSFLVFLVNGRYRTLLDRVLRLRLTPTTSQVGMQVSFEYLNRQLVWHAFTEFLLFLLPLVGIGRWRRLLARAWRKAKSLVRSRSSPSDDYSDDGNDGGELGFLPERTCAICYQDQNPTSAAENEVAALSGALSSGIVGSAQTDITNPYEAIPCGHVFCFVCLAQRIEGEDGDGWTCLRCGEVVRECKPWNGDVVEERRRRRSSSKSSKSVTFVDVPKPEDSVFETLDPMPVEDEHSAAVEAEIEQDIERSVSTQLDESTEWANLVQSTIGGGNDESIGNFNGDTDDPTTTEEEDGEENG